MSDRGWVIATLIMLAAAAYFIVNGHSEEPAENMPDAIEVEDPGPDK